jgi:hypothetical protein
MEDKMALEKYWRLLYYFIPEEVRRQIFDLSLIAGEDPLLEDLGIWPGKMLAALQGHPMPVPVEVPAVFLPLPSSRGKSPEIIIQAVANTVVE